MLTPQTSARFDRYSNRLLLDRPKSPPPPVRRVKLTHFAITVTHTLLSQVVATSKRRGTPAPSPLGIGGNSSLFRISPALDSFVWA